MTAYPNPAGERDPRQLPLPFEDDPERDVIEVFGPWTGETAETDAQDRPGRTIPEADVSGDGGAS